MMGVIGTALAGAAVGAGDVALREIQSQIDRDRQLAIVQAQHVNALELQGNTEAGADRRLDVQEAGQTQRQGAQIAATSANLGTQIAATKENLGAEITSREKIAADALKSHETLTKISLGIQAGHLDLAKQSAAIDNSLKTIQYVNAQEVKNLQDEFATAPPERQKSIKEKIQLLTGKDNDNFIPIPTGFDENTGKPNGYQIFDKKSGVFVQPEKAATTPPPAAIEYLKKNPNTAPDFQKRYGADPHPYLNGSAEPAGPSVPGRPLYSVPLLSLKNTAKRPKGVSPAQAEEAQRELDARSGESRISGG